MYSVPSLMVSGLGPKGWRYSPYLRGMCPWEIRSPEKLCRKDFLRISKPGVSVRDDFQPRDSAADRGWQSRGERPGQDDESEPVWRGDHRHGRQHLDPSETRRHGWDAGHGWGSRDRGGRRSREWQGGGDRDGEGRGSKSLNQVAMRIHPSRLRFPCSIVKKCPGHYQLAVYIMGFKSR